MPWYVPSIKVRKVQSGHPCPGCSLLMHHGDMVAWSGPHDRTIYIHDKCAAILMENSDVISEDSTGAGEPAET